MMSTIDGLIKSRDDANDRKKILNARISSLELRLTEIRELLDRQEDKDCLGVGYSDDCPPWPIVDEVIDSITQALARESVK